MWQWGSMEVRPCPNVECGAGGSKVETGVLPIEAASSWQVVTCVVGGNMSGGVTGLLVVCAEQRWASDRRAASSRRCGIMDGATDSAGFVWALYVGEPAWRERGIALGARGSVANNGVLPRRCGQWRRKRWHGGWYWLLIDQCQCYRIASLAELWYFAELCCASWNESKKRWESAEIIKNAWENHVARQQNVK